MMNKRKLITVFLIFTLAVGAAFALLDYAFALTPGIYRVTGNPDCAELYLAPVEVGPDEDLLDLGPLFGFKIDQWDLIETFPTSGYPDYLDFFLTDGTQNGFPTEVTSGPQDSINTISIRSVDGQFFDWQTEIDGFFGIDAVIVKGGSDSNAYVYFPEAFGRLGLTTPDGAAISHVEFCYDYELIAKKTAVPSFTRTYTWDITKDFDGSYSKFIGDPAWSHDYDIIVDQTVTDSGFAVSGTILVRNPTPYTVIFSVADFAGGVEIPVSCPTYELAPTASTICTYTGLVGGNPELGVEYTNSAAVSVIENTDVDGVIATGTYTFTDPTTVVGDSSVNVTDTFPYPGGEPEALGTASGDVTFDNDQEFTCPTDISLYEGDGKYSYTTVNQALITETGDFDEATITVDCYAPVVSKTADATWYRNIDWTITKDVTPASADRFIGEGADFNYVLTLTKVESDTYTVAGTISVANPAGSPGNMVVDLVDMLGDGSPAAVDCGAGATSVTVAPGATAACSYTGDLAAMADGTNTATGTFNTFAFVATDPYAFGAPTYLEGSEPETITVNDSLYGAVGSFSESGQAIYSLTQTCSANPADYAGDGFISTEYPNTAAINETIGDSDSETVTLNCYAPVVTKDAVTEWFKQYTWDITKSVDPTSLTGWFGDSFTSSYDVFVDQTINEYGYRAFGSISIYNPSGEPITVDVADAVDGYVADVDCDLAEGLQTSLTVAAGATGSCSYTMNLPGTTPLVNTATVTFNGYGFTATANVLFGDPIIQGFPTINVTDYFDGDLVGDVLGSASEDINFHYERPFTCPPADSELYVDGVYTDAFPNTAKILEIQDEEASANVDLTCYVPVVSKDATAEWIKDYDWTITKTAVPSSHTGFAGDSFTSDYDVVVDQIMTETFRAYGSIYVTNPSEEAITVDVADAVDGYAAAVDCGGGSTSLTVAAGTTGSCSYTVDLPDNADRTNTATITFKSVAFLATALVDFGEPTIDGYPEINVTDSYADLGAASGDFTFEYSRPFTCSSSPADYTDGFDSDSYGNTATIDETGQSAEASVTVDCYAPVVSKTADASYDETHTWDIEKDVIPNKSLGYPGDTLSWTWIVTLSESSADSNIAVEGSIFIYNPAGSPGAMTVAVSDILDDGTIATVDCGGATSVAVDPGATATCSYTAAPAGKTATLNTATGTFNGIDFTGTAPFEFAANVINGSAVVTDDQIGLNETVYAGEGTWEWTATHTKLCSSSKADYFVDGIYTPIEETLYNTAYVKNGDEVLDFAKAEHYNRCDAGFMDLLKLTNGLVDPAMTWSFKLYEGGYGGTVIGSGTTEGDADGLLEFGSPALRPDRTYTVCELGIPSAWTSIWYVDWNYDGIFDQATEIVTPYNPDVTPDPNVADEDFGNRCFDFQVEVSKTLKFKVNNSYPGGEPRTPGYWKNWNSCTGGGQYETALANGGIDAGWYVLDWLLPQTIGDLEITACRIGVLVLDHRDIVTEKQAAKYADYMLATHLLAAKLNLAAGAETCPAIQTAVTEAQALLLAVGFDGTGKGIESKHPLYQQAVSLGYTIDQYNNGYLCSP